MHKTFLFCHTSNMKKKRKTINPVAYKYSPTAFDPLGSYTGISSVDLTPTQDADDL